MLITEYIDMLLEQLKEENPSSENKLAVEYLNRVYEHAFRFEQEVQRNH